MLMIYWLWQKLTSGSDSCDWFGVEGYGSWGDLHSNEIPSHRTASTSQEHQRGTTGGDDVVWIEVGGSRIDTACCVHDAGLAVHSKSGSLCRDHYDELDVLTAVGVYWSSAARVRRVHKCWCHLAIITRVATWAAALVAGWEGLADGLWGGTGVRVAGTGVVTERTLGTVGHNWWGTCHWGICKMISVVRDL